MEKDNLKNTLNNINKIFCDLVKKSDNAINKLVAKFGELDNYPNLKTRIISGVVMLILGIIAICVSKWLFNFIVVAITILMTFEWLELTKLASNKRKWQLIGFVYILLPIFSILQLRAYDNILLWMFAVICATDIFAFFAGKNFGGPKLMPAVSPNKTWAGLAGGVTASMIIGFLSSFMFPGGIIFFILISAILSLVEQASDLLESKFKRVFGVKDSGNIIPGHGGVLDRFDGMMLVAPTVLLLVWFFPSSFFGK